MNINNHGNNIFSFDYTNNLTNLSIPRYIKNIDENNNSNLSSFESIKVLKWEIDESFREIKGKIDRLIQSHQELVNDLNPSKTFKEVDSNMIRDVYPNKKRKINNSNHTSNSSQCFNFKTIISDQESQKINNDVIHCNNLSNLSQLRSKTFVDLFIKSLTDTNLKTEQIQPILERWVEIFSKLSCHKKVLALTELEKISRSRPFVTSTKVIEKQISSFIQLTFCKLMSPKLENKRTQIIYRPLYLETFCKLLLNRHCLELTVDEWLSNTENSKIRNKIIFFLSLHLENLELKNGLESSWIATWSLYAHLFYSCHRSSFLIEHFKPHLEAMLFRVEEAKLKLRNSEDQNKEYWLLLIEVAHALFYQRQTEVCMNQLIEKLQKFQDNPNAVTLQLSLVGRLQGLRTCPKAPKLEI